jgi:hypothetical protein
MPTEVRRASARATGHSRTPGISPLLVAATLTLAMLHLVMFACTHASPTIGPPEMAALDDGATCSVDVGKPETSLPYD